MRIVEGFLSIQGEGRSIGQRAFFIRLAGCNLFCNFCDSEYASRTVLTDGDSNFDFRDIPKDCKLIVITGGEPTLYRITDLKDILKSKGRVFEVESNATIFPKYVDEFNWNLSPKLSSSGNEDKKRLQCMAHWSKYARKKTRKNKVIFKFVMSRSPVECTNDAAEIEDIVKKFKIPRELVYLMPEGKTKEDMSHIGWLADYVIKQGYNFSPRLHVMLWGNKRGV